MSLPDPINGDTVMHHALKNGRYHELLEMLLRGGNPFVHNSKGQSVASLFNHYSIEKGFAIKLNVKYEKVTNKTKSLKTHKDPTNHDCIKISPKCNTQQNLHITTDNHHVKIILDFQIKQKISFLIKEIGRKMDKFEETNESLLHRAVRQKSFFKLKIYKMFGANSDMFNLKRQTPRELAVQLKHQDIINFFDKQNN